MTDDKPVLTVPPIERDTVSVTGTFDGEPFTWRLGAEYYPLRLRAKNGKLYELTVVRGAIDRIEGRQL